MSYKKSKIFNYCFENFSEIFRELVNEKNKVLLKKVYSSIITENSEPILSPHKKTEFQNKIFKLFSITISGYYNNILENLLLDSELYKKNNLHPMFSKLNSFCNDEKCLENIPSVFDTEWGGGKLIISMDKNRTGHPSDIVIITENKKMIDFVFFMKEICFPCLDYCNKYEFYRDIIGKQLQSNSFNKNLVLKICRNIKLFATKQYNSKDDYINDLAKWADPDFYLKKLYPNKLSQIEELTDNLIEILESHNYEVNTGVVDSHSSDFVAYSNIINKKHFNGLFFVINHDFTGQLSLLVENDLTDDVLDTLNDYLISAGLYIVELGNKSISNDNSVFYDYGIQHPPKGKLITFDKVLFKGQKNEKK